jgi:hypothetical protein
MELARLFREIEAWPADAVRAGIEQLAATPHGADARLDLMANLIDDVLAKKDPAGATRIAFEQLEKEPRFESGARWSLAQWFARDPAGAESWIAAHETNGTLESRGVEDTARKLVAQSRLLGLGLADAARAREAFRTADPATAGAALLALSSHSPPTPQAPANLVALATAVADPLIGGLALGRWTHAGTHPMSDFARCGEILSAKLPADLPPAIRQAALVEGATFGRDLQHSLTVLSHAAAPQERVATLTALTRQMIAGGQRPPSESWIAEGTPLAPFRNEIAAAAATALGKSGGGEAWLARIADPVLRQLIANNLR